MPIIEEELTEKQPGGNGTYFYLVAKGHVMTKSKIRTDIDNKAILKRGKKRISLIKFNIKTHRRFPLRARVGVKEVKRIMMEELVRRCKQYGDNSNMKKKIMCLVGESGTGKTLASLHLQNKLNANVICSFTTRPPRDTEVEGREHYFVDIYPPEEELLAYVEFYGYKYYAMKSQVFGDCTVYVIDEAGLRNLIKRHGDEYEIYSVYIIRSRSNRRDAKVDEFRMNRDVKRKKNDISTYDYVVDNNSTKKNFFQQIEKIYNEIKEK